jgi:hypothetical protein
MSLFFEIHPEQLLLIPTAMLDADHNGNGSGIFSIQLVFLCFSFGIVFK